MLMVVRPLEVVQEVQEGVAVGVGTGVQQGQHGGKLGVCVLDVYRGEKKHIHVKLRALLSSVDLAERPFQDQKGV